MTTSSTDIDQASAMMDTVPALGEDAKRLAVELYRQLALGEPVRQESLAEALGVPTEEITAAPPPAAVMIALIILLYLFPQNHNTGMSP